MEKFGLFDIIDKFNSASKGENDFSKSERKVGRRRSETRKEKTRQKKTGR